MFAGISSDLSGGVKIFQRMRSFDESRLAKQRCKWSTISLKKGGLVYDLFEKI